MMHFIYSCSGVMFEEKKKDNKKLNYLIEI